MYNIIVMSHGNLAKGLEDALTMIAGEKKEVEFITFNQTDTVEQFDFKVKEVYESIPKNNEVLILGDLYGGTPTNVATRYFLNDPNRVKVVTGINFPFLLAAVLMTNNNLEEVLDGIIYESKQELKKIEKNSLEINEDDE